MAAPFATTGDDDIIDATLEAAATSSTLNPGDQLDGGAGDDTLNVVMNGNFNGFSGAGFLQNVELVNLDNGSGITRTFSATGIADVEEYNLDANSGAISLTNLGDTGATVNLMDQATGTATIGFAAGVVTGTGDSFDIGVDDVGTPASGGVESAVTVTIAGIETLAIEATGDNIVALGANDAKAVSVAGGGDLKLTKLGTAVTGFDGATAEGDLDVNLADAAANAVTSVATGEGDDTIRAGTEDLATTATIAGGAGTDALALTAAAASIVQYAMTGVESVSVGALGGALTFSGTNVSGLQSIAATKDVNANASFANLGTANIDVDLTGSNANAVTVSADQTGTASVAVTASAAATSAAFENNVVDVTFGNATGDLTAEVGQYMNYTGNITATKATSAQATLTGTVTDAIDGVATFELPAATSVVVTSGTKDQKVSIDAAKMTDLSVTSGAGFDLSTNAADSNFDKLANLVVNTSGAFTIGALDELAQATLSGKGAVTFTGLLGGATHTALAINASGMTGALTATGITATSTIGVTTGTGAVDLDNAALAAANVTVDASKALGAVGVAATVSSTATLTGSGLGVNTFGVTGTAAATNMTVAMTGGVAADVFAVKSGAAGNIFALNVAGGTGNDTLTLDGSAFALNAGTSFTMSSIENLVVTDGAANAVTVAGAGVTGQVFTLSGAAANDILKVNGTASAETIDLSLVTAGAMAGQTAINGLAGADTIKGSTGIDVITGGAAADVITGGTGADHFVLNAFYTADTITDFATTSDRLYVDLNVGAVAASKTNNVGAAQATNGTTKAGAFSKTMKKALVMTTGKAKSKAIAITKTFKTAPMSKAAALTAKNIFKIASKAAITKATKLSAMNFVSKNVNSRLLFAQDTAGASQGKVYLFVLNDTKVGTTKVGTAIAKTFTLATVGTQTLVAADIYLF